MVTDKEVEAARLALLNHSGIITTKTVREALEAALGVRNYELGFPEGKHGILRVLPGGKRS
jgi:hypothetical protein